jgi:murein endopeptidase
MPNDHIDITQEMYREMRNERDMWRDKYLALEEEYRNYLKGEVKKMKEQNNTPPEDGDYRGLARWLEEQKTRGNDYYAEADYNRSKMCRNLLKIIGWWPNQDSLRKAQMRG